MRLPLEGVRIVEMGQLIAIPHAIKMLADMGAEVVRVDSCVRLENYRASSLFENSTEGEYWNRAANFYEQNRNKIGLTLDLTKPEGLTTLKELIAISDVFAENFTPRVVRNFGLEYEDVRKIRPDIVMVSSTGYGHVGPWSDFGAIGYTTEASSGLAHMTGYKDGPPLMPDIPYADYTAAEHTVYAIMAALIYRARTGKGQFIDVSQSRAVSATVPEALMDYTVNGRIRERIGNQHASMAPHGCYPCNGRDNWVAIAVATDAQWDGMCSVLDAAHLRDDPRFADTMLRWRNRDALDEAVGKATTSWDKFDLMHALQAAGVPAGAVLDGKELLFNPHLRSRGFYEVVSHHPGTGMPSLPYASRPWKMSESPAGIRHAAPLLGEHNRYILGEFLAKSDEEIEALEADEIIGYEPVGREPPSTLSLDDMKRQGRILDYETNAREQLSKEYDT